MALYVYEKGTGRLESWCPNDTDLVAPQDVLDAKGLILVSGLPPLDDTHAWDETTKTVITVAAPVPEKFIDTGIWVLRFTPQEFSAILKSTDAFTQQWVFALQRMVQINLNDPQVMQGLEYLVSQDLLDQGRIAALVA